MASFAPRGDGLFDVTLDTGITVPMALSQEQLLGGGFQPAAPPAPVMPPPELYAQPAAPAPAPMTQTQGLAQAAPPGLEQGVSDVFSQYGPKPPSLTAPAPPPAAPPAPGLAQGVERVFQQHGAQPAAPKPLVPATRAPGPQGAGGPVDDVDLATEGYRAWLNRQGGYARTPEVPEHDELVGFSVGVGKRPDEKATLHAAIEQQLADDRAREAAQKEAGGMAAMGGGMAKQVEADRQRLDDEMQLRRQRDEEIERRRAGVERRAAKVEQLQADPNKFTNDLGAAGNLFAAVAAALGSFSSAKTGGPNFALQMLEASKERAYQAQLDQISKAKGDVDTERLMLADMIRDHGDPRTAKLEFNIRMDELFDRKLKADALKTGSEQVIADTDALLAQRGAERAERERMLSAQMQDDVQQSWRHVPYQASRVVGGGIDPLKAEKKIAEFREARGKAKGIPVGQVDEKDTRERFIPGEGYAYSAEEGSKIRAAKAGVSQLNKIADEALSIREQVAAGKLGLVEGSRRLQSLKGQGAVAFKNAEQMGALDKGAMEVFGNIFGNPDKFLSTDSVGANTQIRQFKAGVNNKWDAVRRAQISRDPYGRQPAMADTPSSFQEKK